MEKENIARHVVDSMGGVAATAKFFGIKMPSVCEWVKTGKIPKARRLHLLHLRPDLFEQEKSDADSDTNQEE